MVLTLWEVTHMVYFELCDKSDTVFTTLLLSNGNIDVNIYIIVISSIGVT